MKKQLTKWYDSLHDEDDARVCKDITDEACRYVPQNYFIILVSQLSTKLADILANGKTVLPWVLNHAGVPDFFLGLLVPIRESGALLPQLILGAWVRNRPQRKGLFVLGSLVQGVCVAMMALVAYLLSGIMAGIAIIMLLLAFSIARALCSLSSKDVLGKCIPKTRRGSLGGYAGSLAGFMGVLIGAGYGFELFSDDSSLLMLLLGAAIAWCFASFLFSRVEEYRGAEDGGADGVKAALDSLSLLRTDRSFRDFVIARCCLMGSGLAAPYCVLAVNAQASASWLVVNVGTFMVAASAASFVSGFVWGRWVDRSSRKVMIAVSLSLAVLLTCAAILVSLNLAYGSVIFLLVFFVLMLIHQGVRLSRKTYLVDLGSGAKRTDYVAVSNTLVGVVLLLVGLLSAIVGQFAMLAVFVVFAVMAGVAGMFSYRLPEVQ